MNMNNTDNLNLNYKEFDEQLLYPMKNNLRQYERIARQHFICMKESKNFSTNPYKESLINQIESSQDGREKLEELPAANSVGAHKETV